MLKKAMLVPRHTKLAARSDLGPSWGPLPAYQFTLQVFGQYRASALSEIKQRVPVGMRRSLEEMLLEAMR